MRASEELLNSSDELMENYEEMTSYSSYGVLQNSIPSGLFKSICKNFQHQVLSENFYFGKATSIVANMLQTIHYKCPKDSIVSGLYFLSHKIEESEVNYSFLCLYF